MGTPLVSVGEDPDTVAVWSHTWMRIRGVMIHVVSGREKLRLHVISAADHGHVEDRAKPLPLLSIHI